MMAVMCLRYDDGVEKVNTLLKGKKKVMAMHPTRQDDLIDRVVKE